MYLLCGGDCAATGVCLATERYRSFVDWYLKFLRDQADPSTGLWCTPAQKAKYGTINCIGGSFHIDFVFQCVSE